MNRVRNPNSPRFPLAIVAAIMVPPAVVTLILAASMAPIGQIFPGFFAILIFAELIGGPVAALHVLLLGLPYHYFLSKRAGMRWWQAVGGGAVIGFFPASVPNFVAIAAGNGGTPDMAGVVPWLIPTTFAVAGAFGAWAFWLVLRIGTANPETDHA